MSNTTKPYLGDSNFVDILGNGWLIQLMMFMLMVAGGGGGGGGGDGGGC